MNYLNQAPVETHNTEKITLPVSGLKAIIGPYKEE
jgi:hypothetical protein